MFEELKEEYKLDEGALEKLNKMVQSETDKVRTEYTKKIKELEKFRPKEKTEQEIKFESTQKELQSLKFQMSLKDVGVDSGLSKYLRDDIDVEEFKVSYMGLSQKKEDYIARKHIEDVGITKEQFKGMNYEQKANLYNSNPTLYAELKK